MGGNKCFWFNLDHFRLHSLHGPSGVVLFSRPSGFEPGRLKFHWKKESYRMLVVKAPPCLWPQAAAGKRRIGLESERLRRGAPDSGAAAAVHHHGRDLTVDDLFHVVEVEHVDGGHLGGGAAGARGPPGIGLVHQVGVRVLLQVHVLALPGAVVGLVALRGDNPVPAEVLEVHGERVSAAAGLQGVLIAVQTRVSPGPPGALRHLHLHERLLKQQNTTRRIRTANYSLAKHLASELNI